MKGGACQSIKKRQKKIGWHTLMQCEKHEINTAHLKQIKREGP